MENEISELLQTAIYKEIASQAFYEAGQATTDDPGARALMGELAAEERRHAETLKQLEERHCRGGASHSDTVPNLMISDHLTGGDTLDGAGLQDTLLFAIKREQQAVEFYSRLMSVLRDADARQLCERLVHDELRHKLRLETLYDDLFYQED